MLLETKVSFPQGSAILLLHLSHHPVHKQGAVMSGRLLVMAEFGKMMGRKEVSGCSGLTRNVV